MPKSLSACLLPVLAVALPFLTAACASPPAGAGEDEDSSSTSQPIISGEVSPDTQNAVVMLAHLEGAGGGGERCTATLVAPNLVLTARHCVSLTGKQPFYCNKDGTLQNDNNGGGEVGGDYKASDLYVFTGETRSAPSVIVRADAAGRGKKIFHDGAKAVCGHDLALVLLEKNVSAPSAQVRLDSLATKGEKITAVGWGVTLTTNYPAQRQQRTGIPILEVGPYADKRVDVPANDFLVGESTCSGDSGGPAFSEQTGAVIGVVSRGGNGKADAQSEADGCTDADNNYTQTAPFRSLIESAFAEAGYPAQAETGRPAQTDIGGGGSSCSASSVGSSSFSSGGAAGWLGLGGLGLGIAIALRRRRSR